jgi:hypothetical protein
VSSREQTGDDVPLTTSKIKTKTPTLDELAEFQMIED